MKQEANLRAPHNFFLPSFIQTVFCYQLFILVLDMRLPKPAAKEPTAQSKAANLQPTRILATPQTPREK